MKWNSSIRQLHRWLSIAFTLGVLAYMAAMSQRRLPGWLGLFPLLPLISATGQRTLSLCAALYLSGSLADAARLLRH